MGEMAELLTDEQQALWYQHKYGVCDETCPYCQDEDCPPLPDGMDEMSDYEDLLI